MPIYNLQFTIYKKRLSINKLKPFALLAFVLMSMFFVLDKAKALTEECSSNKPPSGVALNTWVGNCIKEIEKEVGALKPAHERNQQELADLKKQLTILQSQINNLNRQISTLGADINAREEDVALQELLLEERVRSFYIKSRKFSPFLAFLFSANATELTRTIALQGQEATEDKRIIEDLSSQIVQLKSDRENLKKNKEGLARVQIDVDKKAEFLKGEVAKVETYLSTLSAKQSQLLAQKAGGFETSVGDTPPTLEPCSGPPGSSNYCDPGFSGFAAFSFGAPHRKGMSQFGAKGRAEAGQSTEDILKAYYGNVRIETRGDPPSLINTTAGSLPLEDQYLMGIAEMPSSWNINALKAQAIAARTYALSYVGWRNSNPNGATGRICTTEACQVYSSSKAANTPDSWKQAVQQTRGQILLSNNTNEIISSWYASTAGGYTFSYTTLGHGTSGGWDADGGRGSWPDSAWDKRGGSPWFYKGWYKTRAGATCGRSHPWLTQEEMADIVNAWQVYFKGGGDASRISPTDTGCWPGNPYSKADLASIGGYTSVSSASIVYGDNGATLEVTLSTNKGSVSIAGEEFKKAFNLRAPGYIGIKSSLFNVISNR